MSTIGSVAVTSRNRRRRIEAAQFGKGTNVIHAAIVNAGGATDFAARFLDEQGQLLKVPSLTTPI